MSKVTKAFDLHQQKSCAIKEPNAIHDEVRLKESFFRECQALSELPHPNIVSFIDAGKDGDSLYMALEWVPYNLQNWIEQHGALSWSDFFSRIGRPVLEAIRFAQSRSWIHRDIKPSNILMTEDGVPKISDYGIAKNIDNPKLGVTFAAFRSAPFTPPEDDSGDNVASRDCYSFAAVALYCLTGKIVENYAEQTALLGTLDPDKYPTEILRAALSDDPSERQPVPDALLAELERFNENRAKDRTSFQCYLRLRPDVAAKAMRLLAVQDRAGVEAYFLGELNEACGIKSRDFDGEPGWRVSAVTWVFDMVRSRPFDGRLLVFNAFQASAAEIERHRETGFQPALSFSFGIPANSAEAAAQVDDLFIELASFESKIANDNQLNRRERIFRLWYSFLRAKTDFEAKREHAITYIEVKRDNTTVVLTAEDPPSADLIGQSRVIRSSGETIVCEVVDVNLDEVIVKVVSGNARRIPRKGRLEVNNFAAEKAIDRQRAALDAVNYDRAAGVRLKSILIDPQLARPPIVCSDVQVADKAFDDEKKRVLAKALGLQDILAIKGPPGTGKTRLISEIIVQYIERNPSHRVLLSSQTHVALDNVIDRVRKRHPELEIVRIGKIDDPKIGDVSRDLLLDRKAEAWAKRVSARASDFMTQWASERGIERSSIEIGMLAEKLIRLLRELEAIKMHTHETESHARAIEERVEARLQETGLIESAALEDEATQIQVTLSANRAAIAALREAIAEVKERLRAFGGYGLELADRDPDELAEWSLVLLGTSEEEKKCRELLQLQEDWILRVGKSTDFHAAMLASAQVVAGTCVGMASVRGSASVVYDLCIVDEASKATATEILVPMSRSRKWILVGDPKQLPPFFEQESIEQVGEFDEEEIRQTLLDRLLTMLPAHSIEELTNQHRMVKPIGDLISTAFYEGRLKSPKSKPDVTLTGAYPKPVTWLSTAELPHRRETQQGKSYRNDLECDIIRDVLRKINFIAKRRRKVYDVALIAGYVAQVRALQDAIRDQLHEWEGLKVDCNTVDAFQGNEAEICIYSVTRSNREGKLGFLREKPRLNVALSRGRSALIIVGDDVFCRRAEGENPFRGVLDFIDNNKDVCELRIIQ